MAFLCLHQVIALMQQHADIARHACLKSNRSHTAQRACLPCPPWMAMPSGPSSRFSGLLSSSPDTPAATPATDTFMKGLPFTRATSTAVMQEGSQARASAFRGSCNAVSPATRCHRPCSATGKAVSLVVQCHRLYCDHALQACACYVAGSAQHTAPLPGCLVAVWLVNAYSEPGTKKASTCSHMGVPPPPTGPLHAPC